jgi:hypothetical protein
MSSEEYCARVLARIGAAVVEHADDPRGLLVSYDELPGAVFTEVLPLFGIRPEPKDRDRMEEAALLDAKNPVLRFEPDGLRKREMASAAVVNQAERWLRPVHDCLEETRLRQRARKPTSDPHESRGSHPPERRP